MCSTDHPRQYGLEFEGTEYVKANVDMAGSPFFDDAQLMTVYRATVEKFGYGQITAEQAAAEIHKAVTDKLASV